MSLAQYNKALDDRREAWVNSTHLPQSVKNDLKNADHTKPELSDPRDTRLPMLAQQEVRALKEHHQMLRDQVMLRSMQGTSGFQPRSERGKPRDGKRCNNSGRGTGYQGYNNYQNSGARGRGSNRGRSNYRPRGRQGNQQPFSEPQSQKKQD